MTPGLIDTHAHLTSDALAGDVQGVLERAARAGVTRVITIGTDLADSRRAVELAETQAGVFASVGIHPHEAAKASAQDYSALEALLAHPKVVAIGEIGLDYHYDFSDRASQHEVFRRQLEIARRFERPLVIHCREAVADAVDWLKSAGFEGRPVVFHCFTGTADEARLIADHGWRISFTGIVTYRKSEALQALARSYPADQLMLETDAPYLSPEPVRKIRPNEPALLRHTADFLAHLRGVSVEEIARQTTRNAVSFFHLAEETVLR